ncbi:hypothetical protein AAL_03416 [Moelleriella libera RCEF 2490]|uniref:Uncharacterized protein n=1 Tax=Moelleriella libera RCEF 2490 TaxID=1081109 RepID=A0A162IRA3_9HYPO|nr:hypothetical protein AAL_03416 [Moelleriella libera RCEF 2490]
MAQASVQPQDLSMMTATVLFFQTVGGAALISAGQGSLLARTISELPKNGVTIDPNAVIAAGASDIPLTFPAEAVPGILKSYVSGLRVAFAIAIAGMGVAAVTSVVGSWQRFGSKGAAASLGDKACSPPDVFESS